MEIKFINTLYKDSTNEVNFVLKENEILGIVNGKTYDILNKELISGEIRLKHYVLNKKYDEKKITRIKENIYFCNNDLNELFEITIMDDINRKIKNVDGKRVYELFKLFDLNKEILDLPYTRLSTSEKKKILLMCSLMTDKDIIIYENPTNNLDNKSINSFIKELKRLKRNKIIIIYSSDTDFLLKVSQNILIYDDKKIIIDNKYNILSNEKLLNGQSIKVPELLMFINRVRDLKNINLGFRDNINDTIKDVYRHV